MRIDPSDPEFVAYVTSIVDKAPPLTEAQRTRLATLFRRPRPINPRRKHLT